MSDVALSPTSALDDASWAAFLEYKRQVTSPPTDAPLRFKVGDAVRAHVGPNEWAAASVVGLWWRLPAWPPSFFAPYQLRLETDGSLIFAAVDADTFVIGASGPPPEESALDHDPQMTLGWPADVATRLEWEQSGYTPLHVCCMPPAGNEVIAMESCLRSLLRRPLQHPDHNRNRGAETPLHTAIRYSRLECVKLLLAAGANPRALNGQMQTALQMAESAMEATEATFPWCGPQDKLYILLLAKRVAAELGEEEDDEEEEWVDVEEDEASSSRPVKTIRKGRLNKRMAS